MSPRCRVSVLALLLLACCLQVFTRQVFRSVPEARSVFLRSKRANSFLVEEILQGNLERECYEELCSYEEAREYFEDDAKTIAFWTVYYDGDQCDPNPCFHGGTCTDKVGGFDCLCRPPHYGPACELGGPPQPAAPPTALQDFIPDEPECPTEGPTACHQFCKSLRHSFICSCMPGFKLQTDGRSCVPEVEYPCGRVSNQLSTTTPMCSHGNCPWQVSLMDSRGAELCGGVVLGQRSVLTAAKCLFQDSRSDPRPYNFYVAAGSGVSKVLVPVQALHLHSRFSRAHHDNDLAVLQLAQPLNFGPALIHLCLPNKDFSENILMHSGRTGLTAGHPNDRQTQQLVYMTLDECRTQLNVSHRLSNKMFCMRNRNGLARNQGQLPPDGRARNQGQLPPDRPARNHGQLPPDGRAWNHGQLPPDGRAWNHGQLPPDGPARNQSQPPPNGPARNQSQPPPNGPARNHGQLPPDGPARNQGQLPPDGRATNQGQLPPDGPARNQSQPPPNGPAKNHGQLPPDGPARNQSQPPPNGRARNQSQLPLNGPARNQSQPPPNGSARNQSQPPPNGPARNQSQPPPNGSARNQSQPPPNGSARNQDQLPHDGPVRNKTRTHGSSNRHVGIRNQATEKQNGPVRNHDRAQLAPNGPVGTKAEVQWSPFGPLEMQNQNLGKTTRLLETQNGAHWNPNRTHGILNSPVHDQNQHLEKPKGLAGTHDGDGVHGKSNVSKIQNGRATDRNSRPKVSSSQSGNLLPGSPVATEEKGTVYLTGLLISSSTGGSREPGLVFAKLSRYLSWIRLRLEDTEDHTSPQITQHPKEG